VPDLLPAHDPDGRDVDVRPPRRTKEAMTRCHWCGAKTQGGPACRGHADLPELEREYNEPWARTEGDQAGTASADVVLLRSDVRSSPRRSRRSG
jgi:hypothetical protein